MSRRPQPPSTDPSGGRRALNTSLAEERERTRHQRGLLERTQQRLAEVKELSLSQRKMAELHRQSRLMVERSYDDQFSESYNISCSRVLPLIDGDFETNLIPKQWWESSHDESRSLVATSMSRQGDNTASEGFEDNLRFITFGYSVFALPLNLIEIDFCQFVSPNSIATLERVPLSRRFQAVKLSKNSNLHCLDESESDFMQLCESGSSSLLPNRGADSSPINRSSFEAGLPSIGANSEPIFVKTPVIVERQSVIRPSSVADPDNKERQERQEREKLEFVRSCYQVLKGFAFQPHVAGELCSTFLSGDSSKAFRRKIAHSPYPDGHMPLQLPRWLLCRHFKAGPRDEGDSSSSRLADENISLYKVSDQRCLAFELSPNFDSDDEETAQSGGRQGNTKVDHEYELNLPLLVIWNDLVEALQILHRSEVLLRSLSPLVVLVSEGVQGTAGPSASTSAPRKHLGARAEVDVSWGMLSSNLTESSTRQGQSPSFTASFHPLPLPLSSKGDLTVYGTSRPDLFHVLGEYNLFIPPELVEALDSVSSDSSSTTTTTPLPTPPGWNQESDFWSLGVTMMLFCLTALKGKCPADVKTVVANTREEYHLKLSSLRREFTRTLQEVVASDGSGSSCLANGPFSGMCTQEAEFFLQAVSKLISADPAKRNLELLFATEDDPSSSGALQQGPLRRARVKKEDSDPSSVSHTTPKQRYLLSVNKLKLALLARSRGERQEEEDRSPRMSSQTNDLETATSNGSVRNGSSRWLLPQTLDEYASMYNILRQQLIYQPHRHHHEIPSEVSSIEVGSSSSSGAEVSSYSQQNSLKRFVLEFIAGSHHQSLSSPLQHHHNRYPTTLGGNSSDSVQVDDYCLPPANKKGSPMDSVLPEMLPLLLSPQCPTTVLRSLVAVIETAAVE